MIDNICSRFMELLPNFRWFIVQYFGGEFLEELINLASEQKSETLRSYLNDIWFKLPDNIFNIRENPKGWYEFLSLLEE